MEVKRAKVVALPTKDNTKGVICQGADRQFYHSNSHVDNEMYRNHNLYFITDEQPVIGDIAYKANSNKIWLLTLLPQKDGIWSKVIASTDLETKLPQPSKVFIEKYCKLGGIEYVLIANKRLQSLKERDIQETVTLYTLESFALLVESLNVFVDVSIIERINSKINVGVALKHTIYEKDKM